MEGKVGERALILYYNATVEFIHITRQMSTFIIDFVTLLRIDGDIGVSLSRGNLFGILRINTIGDVLVFEQYATGEFAKVYSQFPHVHLFSISIFRNDFTN